MTLKSTVLISEVKGLAHYIVIESEDPERVDPRTGTVIKLPHPFLPLLLLFTIFHQSEFSPLLKCCVTYSMLPMCRVPSARDSLLRRFMKLLPLQVGQHAINCRCQVVSASKCEIGTLVLNAKLRLCVWVQMRGQICVRKRTDTLDCYSWICLLFGLHGEKRTSCVCAVDKSHAVCVCLCAVV